MNSSARVLTSALFALLFAKTAFSQFPSPQPAARTNSVVTVQELAMPRKAARAFDKGTALLIKGNAQASIRYFLTVIDEEPHSYRAYHNLGLALYRLGQFDAAAHNFQKSIDITNGNFAPSLFAFAIILYRQSDFIQAESLIRKGLFLEPSSAIGKYCLGLVQYSLGRVNEAQRSATEAIGISPLETDAYLLLAHTHERQHNSAAVITDIQNYFRLDPHGDLQAEALTLLQRAQQDRTAQSQSAFLN